MPSGIDRSRDPLVLAQTHPLPAIHKDMRGTRADILESSVEQMFAYELDPVAFARALHAFETIVYEPKLVMTKS